MAQQRLSNINKQKVADTMAGGIGTGLGCTVCMDSFNEDNPINFK